MIYFPFSLQRRFLTAYFVPVSLVGIAGLAALEEKVKVRRVIPVVIIATILTNVLVWSSAWFGVLSRNPNVFLSKDEREAISWLDNRAERGSVVAAGPYLGMLIPGRTALRVVYGHPFETAYAERELAFIDTLFKGLGDLDLLRAGLSERKVSYIVRGEREAALGVPALLDTLPVVYENATVKIYQFLP
jgi:hypothetical protein